jgi:hypothetical protein
MKTDTISSARPAGTVAKAAGALLVAVLAGHLAGTDARAQSVNQGPVLFTPAEAVRLRLSDQEWRSVPRARALSTGPIIVVEKLRVDDSEGVPIIQTTTPVDLLVSFRQRSAPVDMNSLDVEAHKGFFSKSLTDVVRRYIKGNSLQIEKARLPIGKFLLDIKIADQDGDTTDQSYRLEIDQP